MYGFDHLRDRVLAFFQIMRAIFLGGLQTFLRKLQELLAAFLQSFGGGGFKTVIERSLGLIESDFTLSHLRFEFRVLRQQALSVDEKDDGHDKHAENKTADTEKQFCLKVV